MERGDGGIASRGGGGGVVGSAATLGLDMHLAPQQIHPVAFQQQQGGGGFQLQQAAPVRQHQHQPPSFSPYSNSSSRAMTAATSHDEEMAGNGKQQQPGTAVCPWTRMKWTDAMVRLLIQVVYSVGDDGEGVGPPAGAGGGSKAAPHGNKSSQQQQQAQKKGKWKSVSRAMMEKGFLVSPQQCEDKFNDLNKRYKRVVDLLGRGRACRVVENHALLDAIDELTPKAKDEARKLLSSKHLFFREMCAYHNSGGAPHAPSPHLPPNHASPGDAACLHHPPPTPMAAAAASSAARQPHPSPPGTKADSSADDNSEDGVSNNEDDDEDDFDEEDDGGHMYPNNHNNRHHHQRNNKRARGADDGEDMGGEDDDKRARGGEQSAALQQLQSDLASAPADPQAAKGWVRRRAVEVEEQQVSLEWRAHQLERQRLKWERFRANKERDMERARLRNQRLRLDAQRMLLMLRHRDMELDMAEANSSVDHHPGQGLFAAHLGSSPSTATHPN